MEKPVSLDTPTIIWLDDSRALEHAQVGNKAANLARLISCGYPVPEGFCIPVGSSPDMFLPELKKALSTLPAPWAVRSSSTAEDGKGLAFPGIFKTILGSSSSEDAVQAIKKVLSSKDSATVKRYAKQHGVSPDQIKMAVIIQKLVRATCSGVAFGRNPVTGENTVTIEAVWGLGETLVDGSITPDYFEIAPNGEINNHRIGTKKEKAVFSGGRFRRLAATEQERISPALTQAAARNLASVVRNIGKDFGTPQDVEWAISEGKIYITQARPITT